MNFEDLPTDSFSLWYGKFLMASSGTQNLDNNFRSNNYLPYSFWQKYIYGNSNFSKIYYCGYYDSTYYFYYIDGTSVQNYRFITYNKSENFVGSFVYGKVKFDNYTTQYFSTYNLYYGGADLSSPFNKCFLVSNNSTVNRHLKVGTSYLDDFMYSNHSSDIFITSLYFFIPIFIFILALKVLRKGLFK